MTSLDHYLTIPLGLETEEKLNLIANELYEQERGEADWLELMAAIDTIIKEYNENKIQKLDK